MHKIILKFFSDKRIPDSRTVKVNAEMN